MSIRLKVSYEDPENLRRLLERLRPDVKSWKVARNREGREIYRLNQERTKKKLYASANA